MTKPRTTTRKRTTPDRDVYQEVTDSIVAALETCGSYSRPWVELSDSASNPRSIDGRKYRGANTFLLWISAMEHGYEHGVWGTYNAWKNHGAQVRKGEKATLVTLWKSFDRKPTADEISGGADPSKTIKSLVLRHFQVFNAAQVDGYEPPATPERDTPDAIEHCEAFFAAVGANVIVRPGTASASYSPVIDAIVIEALDNFTSAPRYYSTLAHEHGHWTGHESRLDRREGMHNRFGDEAYAAEELVAELTAAFVGAHLGIAPIVRDDHAAYVKSWIKALRNDKKAIFTAASQAQKAADFLLTAAGELSPVVTIDTDQEVAA